MEKPFSKFCFNGFSIKKKEANKNDTKIMGGG